MLMLMLKLKLKLKLKLMLRSGIRGEEIRPCIPK